MNYLANVNGVEYAILREGGGWHLLMELRSGKVVVTNGFSVHTNEWDKGYYFQMNLTGASEFYDKKVR